MYEGVRDEAHLIDLLNRDPVWGFFEFEEITDQLFHLNGYSHLLKKYKPQSVEDLAMILAIIRPSKSHLQGKSWYEIRKEVWVKDTDEGYAFKRGHGLAYSLAIVVNLNLLIEQMSAG
jgi:DNA polymerase III alpha subunit